jgi:acyl carrier protein
MTRKTLTDRLIAILNDIQERLAHPPVAITEDCVPLRDLPQFDSLVALEVSVELETHFECLSEENLFFDEKTKRPLRVGEIVDRLSARLGSAEPSNV